MHRIGLLLLVCLAAACSSQQWYEAGQDWRCEEYYKNEDPYRKTQCPEEPYEEYKRKRQEAEKDSGK